MGGSRLPQQEHTIDVRSFQVRQILEANQLQVFKFLQVKARKISFPEQTLMASVIDFSGFRGLVLQSPDVRSSASMYFDHRTGDVFRGDVD